MFPTEDDPYIQALLREAMQEQEESESTQVHSDGVPLVGQIQMAPPVVVTGPDGKSYFLPQVFVSMANEQILIQIAARTAVATAHEVIAQLRELGVIAEPAPKAIHPEAPPPPAQAADEEPDFGAMPTPKATKNESS